MCSDMRTKWLIGLPTMAKLDVEECAEWMCDEDATTADAMCDTAEDAARYPDWRGSNEKRRDHFREKARKAVAAGHYIIGHGWVDAD